MKFLKDDGTIEDGKPLTDRQVEVIERLTDYLHTTVCMGKYHGRYDKHGCIEAANYLVPMLDDSAVGSLRAALFVPEPEPSPVPEPEATGSPKRILD